MKIDAHHHFWKYDPEKFAWIDETMIAIRRDFGPDDLKDEILAAGIDGVVSVQSQQSTEETSRLLKFADENDFIRGVVGWVELINPAVRDALAEFAENPKLKAVRHVLHDEADNAYMLRDDFNRGIDALSEFNLAYDILIFERHLERTIEFVDRHPNQVFVLDHMAKPKIRENIISPWRENIRKLAERENVYCKLSGMVTEAGYDSWTIGQLRPYVEVVIEAFGASRVMFGSDWPVCLVACDYQKWYRTTGELLAGLSDAQRERVLGLTACEAYRL